MCCFALFMVKITKTEMETMPAIVAGNEAYRIWVCQRAGSVAESSKGLCTGLWGDDKVNNSEVEHKITKLEITSVKTGLCDSWLVSPTGKVMSTDVFWLS